jgi:hypothetical protein
MSGSATTPLKTQLVVRKLADLVLLPEEENARFMRNSQFRQLTENLKADTVLTSVPLVYRDTVYSGNHRVKAALAAGIEEAPVLELVGHVTEERLRALQLSHNELSGEDDPGVLARLYGKLGFNWKRYSGLTDERVHKLRELSLKNFAVGNPRYQELVLLFLPEQLEVFQAALETLEHKIKKSVPLWLASLSSFDVVFDAVVKVKKLKGVTNSAIAFRALAELALERLAQIETAEAPKHAALDAGDEAEHEDALLGMSSRERLGDETELEGGEVGPTAVVYDERSIEPKGG